MEVDLARLCIIELIVMSSGTKSRASRVATSISGLIIPMGISTGGTKRRVVRVHNSRRL